MALQGMQVPPSVILGKGSVQGTMQGSHAEPTISTKWELPGAQASGTAVFSPKTTAVTCKAPAVDVSGALHVIPPDFEAVKKAMTQAEVSALAVPVSLRLGSCPQIRSRNTSDDFVCEIEISWLAVM